jgi:hypothetical protein
MKKYIIIFYENKDLYNFVNGLPPFIRVAFNWNTTVHVGMSNLTCFCLRFDMVEIIGKNRRKVPVILTEDVKAAIMVLNKSRQDCKVSESNEFIFAVNNGKSENSLRGHDVLQKTCANVQLEQPNLVKTTNLRKYVATVSQLVDMNESEMGWLANHLGHDIHVHKEFYRLPQTTLEMAVVGNLLMAVDEGRAHLFKGKNPRDITLAGKKKLQSSLNRKSGLLF